MESALAWHLVDLLKGAIFTVVAIIIIVIAQHEDKGREK